MYFFKYTNEGHDKLGVDFRGSLNEWILKF